MGVTTQGNGAVLSLLLLSTAAFVAASDPFLLSTTSFNQTLFAQQPYVSNGYIGQRIPVEGFGYKEMTAINASAMDGTSGWPLFDPRFTAAMVAGFYDQQNATLGTNFEQTGGEQPISTLPTWSSLYLTLPSLNATYEVGTPSSQVSNWNQSMSITNGVVTTSLVWTPPGLPVPSNGSLTTNSSGIKLVYTIFAHRTKLNLGVVRLDVEGLEAGMQVSVTDVLDGAGSWRTTPTASSILLNFTDTIYTSVNPDGINNVTAYLTSTSVLYPFSLNITRSPSCYSSLSTNASTISQCSTFTAPANGKISAIKYVGIASSDAFPGIEFEVALQASRNANATGHVSLLDSHTKAWEALWNESDIIIGGTEDSASMRELQLVTRASLFHLLSNVRQGSEGAGIGDNSIAPAGLTSDSYAGQIFWDADIWMFPSLNALFPSYAESITNFRYRQLGAAKQNALLGNRTGALYPWTAGRFGNCTGVGPCYNYEYHLENDISLAQYQYFASSQNMTWLNTTGWPVISALAEFWTSQVMFNSTSQLYATLNETDPDEYANFRNNAAFTNAGIQVILRNAVELGRVLDIEVPGNWTTIADKITVFQDPTSGIILEYDGFNGSTAVKQADVVLLTYPLEYSQSTAQGLQDLDFYALATSPNGPGMTYSIFSIDASTLSPIGCASWTYLLASSQPYSRAPFYQFSEQTTDAYATNGGTNPAYTFLTGHGGFLQSLTHGFTGYRSRLHALYLDPVLPNQLSNYTLKGMKWNGSVFDIILTTNMTTVTRTSGNATGAAIEIARSNSKAGNYTLKVGEFLTIPTRKTNGTLVEGNLAQCAATTSLDSGFQILVPDIVPGQYALAAIDGSNATTWQPLSNATASMVVDLATSQNIKGLHFNWGSNPSTSYAIYFGNSSTNVTSLLTSGNVTISTPYNISTIEDVVVRVGNTTDVTLLSVVTARYINVTITGSFLEDGRGGTLAELAVL